MENASCGIAQNCRKEQYYFGDQPARLFLLHLLKAGFSSNYNLLLFLL